MPERLEFINDQQNPDVVTLRATAGDDVVMVRAYRPDWIMAERGQRRETPARDLFEADLIDVEEFERRLERELSA
jgi:hypothetical protein